MNKAIFTSFGHELIKISAFSINPSFINQNLGSLGKKLFNTATQGPSWGARVKQGVSNLFHGSRPTMTPSTIKPQLTPGWKKASIIGKGVLGGAAAAGAIGLGGIIYGGLTMEPDMSGSFSGEGSSSQGPVYGR